MKFKASLKDFDTYEEYAIDRMRTMIKLADLSDEWLQQRPTKFQELVQEMAHRKIEQCEQRFGISRYDERVTMEYNLS